MAKFIHKLGRREIFFTDHALDRWWERCEKNDIHGRQQALDLLKSSLDKAKWDRDLPAWSRLSRWNRAQAEGFVEIDEASGFVVNKNKQKNGYDRVAVTYIDNIELKDGYDRNR